MSTLPAILGMCASLFGNFSQNPKPWQRVPGLPKSAAQAGQGLQGTAGRAEWSCVPGRSPSAAGAGRKQKAFSAGAR